LFYNCKTDPLTEAYFTVKNSYTSMNMKILLNPLTGTAFNTFDVNYILNTAV